MQKLDDETRALNMPAAYSTSLTGQALQEMALAPGIRSVSNSAPDVVWPKAEWLEAGLSRTLTAHPATDTDDPTDVIERLLTSA